MKVSRMKIEQEMKFCPNSRANLLSLFMQYKSEMSDYCFAYYIKKLYPMNLDDIYDIPIMTIQKFYELLKFKQYDFIIDSLKKNYIDDFYLKLLLKYTLLQGDFAIYPSIFNSLYFLIRDNIGDNFLLDILNNIVYCTNTSELQYLCITIYELIFGSEYHPIINLLVSTLHMNEHLYDLCYEILTTNNVEVTYGLIYNLYLFDKQVIYPLLKNKNFYDDLYQESCFKNNIIFIQDLFPLRNTNEFTNFLLV